MARRADGPFDPDEAARRLISDMAEAVRRPNFHRYKPSEKQQLFHANPKKHRLYAGGNRAGKTVAGCIEAIRYASGEHPDRKVPEAPNYGRIVGTDFPSGIDKVVIPTMKQWMPKSLLINGSWDQSFSKQDHVLELSNGSIIEFMSADQDLDKFAGASRHWVWFDEEPPELIYDECRARLIDTYGDFWMTLTPVAGMEYIYDKIYVPGKGDPDSVYGVVEADMADNPYLDQQSVRDYLNSLSPEQRRIRGQGQFIQVEGMVFPMFSVDTHVVPSRNDWSNPTFPVPGVVPKTPFKLKRYHRVYCSIDYGWRDPTAIYWHAVDTEGRVVTFREYYISYRTIPQHAEEFERINLEIAEQLNLNAFEPYLIVGDPALKQTSGITGTSVLQEFQKHGVNVVVDMIPRDIQIGVDRMTQYLGIDPRTKTPFWTITEDCPELITELGSLRWERRVNRQQEFDKNKLVKVQDKRNHGFDSTRYFFTLMDDLSPKTVRKLTERAAPFEAAAMLNYVQMDNRRDDGGGWRVEPSDWSGLEG